MKPKTQKLMTGILLILSLVMVVSLLTSATPSDEEKKQAIQICKENKDDKCPNAKTDLWTISMAVGVGFFFFFLLKIFFRKEELILVDKEEATQFYLNWLEDHRKISFPRGRDRKFMFKETSEDTDTKYRMILSYYDKTMGKTFYAPIEIGKYYVYNKDGEQAIELGTGRGNITSDVDQAKIFETKEIGKPKEEPGLNLESVKTIFDEMFTDKMKEKETS